MFDKKRYYQEESTKIFKELYPEKELPDWFEDFIQAAQEHKTKERQIRTYIQFLMEIENQSPNKEASKVKINVLISMFTIT